MDKKQKDCVEDIARFEKLQKECLEVFKKKNKDYGRAYKDFPTIWLIVRTNDKVKLALNITESGITLVNDEKIFDTIQDLANYAIIALMELELNQEKANKKKPVKQKIKAKQKVLKNKKR